MREEDQNRDGKLDFLSLQIRLPLKAEEQVYSVQLLLTFSYQLFVCIRAPYRECTHARSPLLDHGVGLGDDLGYGFIGITALNVLLLF